MAVRDLIVRLIADDQTSRGFGGAIGGLTRTNVALAAVGAAAGAFAASSVKAGAEFDATIRQVAAVAGVPKPELKVLSDLALKFGEDTKFSAGEAADAILELAKGGLSTAQIKAGALKETLTLAAAGGIGLGDAATVMSNALNSFGIKAEDSGRVAAALAGGANASTASVESLAQALGQVGPGAVNAGLGLDTTVAALAAFDQAGIKGSDAGTSLKTFLARLVPATQQAAGAFADLGLDVQDSEGNFRSLSEIAEQLRVGTVGMSDAQRTAALDMAFGSDASRAAIVLAKEGAAGIDRYTKATNDSGAANRMAKANMEGTKGALEQLSGSWDTLKTRAGLALGPIVERLALLGAAVLKGVVPALGSLGTALGPVFSTLQTVGGALADNWQTVATVVGATAAVLSPVFIVLGAQYALVAAAAVSSGVSQVGAWISAQVAAVASAAQSVAACYRVVGGWVLMGAQALAQAARIAAAWLIAIGPVALVIAAVVGLGVLIYKNFDTIKRTIGDAWDWVKTKTGQAWDAIKTVFSSALEAVKATVSNAFNAVKTSVTTALDAVRTGIGAAWDAIKVVFTSALDAVRAVVTAAFNAYKTVITSTMSAIGDAVLAVFNGLRLTISGALTAISGVITVGWNAIKTVFTGALAAISSTVTGGFAAVRTVIGGAMGSLGGAVSAGIGTVVGLFTGLGGRILGAVAGFGSMLVNAGRELMEGLARGISEKIDAVVSKVRAAAQKIKDLLPGSPVKTGPLTSWNGGGAGKRLMGLLQDGIETGTPGVRRALSSALVDAGDLSGLAVGGARYVDSRLAATAGTAPAEPGGADLAGLLQQLIDEQRATREVLGRIPAEYRLNDRAR